MRTELFWLLSFCGFAALSLVCGLLVGPQLAAVWPSIEERIDQFRHLPPLVKLLLLVFVGAFVVYGSTKTNLVDGTGLGPRSMPTMDDNLLCTPTPHTCTSAPPTVTPEDIARGWQLWEVRTNRNISYAMPEGATLATNWWVRGAFEDVKEIGLGGLEGLEWRFPFGTNEYGSAWAFTWGKARFALCDTNAEIVAVGAPMSAVPYRSRLWSAADTNGARVVTWENFALNRDTNTPVNAQIELRTTGDFIVRSNEVETVYHRIDDFDWDGDGIVNENDANPYQYDGDRCGQEPWWREYVDETVGVGLTNGYYKLTATVPDLDFQRRVIVVGDERIVVAEPGEYVFLLEKGMDYEVDVYPFSPDVTFEAVDDLPALPWAFGLLGGWWSWSPWTIDGGLLTLRSPGFGQTGYCYWLPVFQATPPISHLGPGASPGTFTAVLSDFAYGLAVAYHWETDDWNISIDSPDSEGTGIRVETMPRWASSSVSVTASFGDHVLESVCAFTYGEHSRPEVNMEVSAPSVLLLNSNRVDSAKIGQVCVSFDPDVETNGVLRVYADSTEQRVRLIGECRRSVTGADSLYVDIEGVLPSASVGDVAIVAVFEPDCGEETVTERSSLTVVQVNDVILPGAPNDGLVVSTGTSVDFDVDVLPEGAKGLLSTLYKVRRLKGNGSYTEWNYAAGNYGGTEAIYNPAGGGIYQVQATVGVGWGAEDERYYVWKEDENRMIGPGRKGSPKSFGVVTRALQKTLRECALNFLGSTAYLNTEFLPAQYGFSSYPAGDLVFKCNIFVAHRIVESGLFCPSSHGWMHSYPPLANDWANPSYEIGNWEVVSAEQYPEPGYVASDPDPDASGHMGILDFDGFGISAGTANVNRYFDTRSARIVLRRLED